MAQVSPRVKTRAVSEPGGILSDLERSSWGEVWSCQALAGCQAWWLTAALSRDQRVSTGAMVCSHFCCQLGRGNRVDGPGGHGGPPLLHHWCACWATLTLGLSISGPWFHVTFQPGDGNVHFFTGFPWTHWTRKHLPNSRSRLGGTMTASFLQLYGRNGAQGRGRGLRNPGQKGRGRVAKSGAGDAGQHPANKHSRAFLKETLLRGKVAVLFIFLRKVL